MDLKQELYNHWVQKDTWETQSETLGFQRQPMGCNGAAEGTGAVGREEKVSLWALRRRGA